MGANKASGLDGLPLFFFQVNSEVVGLAICGFIWSAFEKGSFPPVMNETLITLILKKEAPECISHFRPVMLCNVGIKGITKIIANRLKNLVPKLVSDQQCSFIPGRQRIDNVVIV